MLIENSLRQGYCIATVLFNLYICLVVECWHHRIHVAEGVGVTVRYKTTTNYNGRYTRNAMEEKITECEFVDDGVLAVSVERKKV